MKLPPVSIVAKQGMCRQESHRRFESTAFRYVVSCACLTFVLGTCATGHAQGDPAGATPANSAQTYDDLLDRAVEAFDAEEFERAHDLFAKAYELRPNARLLRGMGIAAMRLEHYSEAYPTLKAALEHDVQPLTSSQRDEVGDLLSWMETHLANVRLRWSPSEPSTYTLAVDDVALAESALWLAPGPHHITIRAPGYDTLDRLLDLSAGQHQVLELERRKTQERVVAVQAPRPEPTVSPSDAAHSLARHGSERETRHTREPTTSSPSRDDGGSVLTSWWLWTAVGVVAAGGVVTAVLLSNPASTQPPDTNGAVVIHLPPSGM